MNLNSPHVIRSPRSHKSTSARPKLITPNRLKNINTGIVRQLYNGYGKITVSRKLLGRIVKKVMEDIEREGLNGEQAKETAIEVLRLIINEHAPAEEKEWLLAAIDEDVVGELIDIIILASKGELEINHGTQLAKKCVPCSLKTIFKKLRSSKTHGR